MIERLGGVSPSFFVVEVSEDFYERVRDGKVDIYLHVPSETVEGIVIGDTLTFHCDSSHQEYSIDLERKILRIEINKAEGTKDFYFEKAPLPAWKRRQF